MDVSDKTVGYQAVSFLFLGTMTYLAWIFGVHQASMASGIVIVKDGGTSNKPCRVTYRHVLRIHDCVAAIDFALKILTLMLLGSVPTIVLILSFWLLIPIKHPLIVSTHLSHAVLITLADP